MEGAVQGGALQTVFHNIRGGMQLVTYLSDGGSIKHYAVFSLCDESCCPHITTGTSSTHVQKYLVAAL